MIVECTGVLAAVVNRSLVCALDPSGKSICNVIRIVDLSRLAHSVRPVSLSFAFLVFHVFRPASRCVSLVSLYYLFVLVLRFDSNDSRS